MKIKTALVVMPWSSLLASPLGVAALKSHLEREGFPVDCFHLNLRMFPRIGGMAQQLGEVGFLWSEWPFAYNLFGPGGSGEMPGIQEQMLRLPKFRTYMANIGISETQMKRLAHEVVPDFLQECMQSVPWGDYDLIGFSSSYWNHVASLALSRRVKAAFPDAKIVFGGSNVEGGAGIAVLQGCDWIDYVVDGEGEDALLRLARNLSAGRPFARIPRVSWRKGRTITPRDPGDLPRVDMTRMTVPDHGPFFAEVGRVGLHDALEPFVTFEGARGCWWGAKRPCNFCGLNGRDAGFRAKKPEQVAQEIITLHRRYRVGMFQACDLVLGREHAQRLLPELADMRERQGMDLSVYFEVRGSVTDPQMRALAAAGASMQIGVESLSTRLLKLLNKGVTAMQNIQALKLAAVHRVSADWNFLHGIPGERPADYARMARTILAVTHLQPPEHFNPIMITRFSQYHKNYAGFGLSKPRPDKAYGFFYPAARFDIEAMANFFNAGGRRPPRGLKAAVALVDKSIGFWRKTWKDNFFACRYGLDFVILYDSRPARLDGSTQFQRCRLDGLEAAIFRACRTTCHFRDILASCRQVRPGTGEKQVRAGLRRMAARRWILGESDRYLNLAVPVSSLTPLQRLAFDRMAMLGQKITMGRPRL